MKKEQLHSFDSILLPSDPCPMGGGEAKHCMNLSLQLTPLWAFSNLLHSIF